MEKITMEALDHAVHILMLREANDFHVWFDREAEYCWVVTRDQHSEVREHFRSLEAAMSYIAEFIGRTQF